MTWRERIVFDSAITSAPAACPRISREHLERAVELFGAAPSRTDGAFFAQAAPNVLASALIILGYPSTARTRTHELMAAARR